MLSESEGSAFSVIPVRTGLSVNYEINENILIRADKINLGSGRCVVDIFIFVDFLAMCNGENRVENYCNLL